MLYTIDEIRTRAMPAAIRYGVDALRLFGSYARGEEELIREDDLIVAIRSSGNSKNIINAVETVKHKKAEIITFTGFEPDNQLKQLGDMNVYVSCKKYGIVESTLLYNFINDAPVSELAVLRHLLRLLILCWFRLFLRKWHKIPAGEFVRLAQTETPARFLSDI